MIKIKFSNPDSNWPFDRQTPKNSCKWGDYEFFINQDIQKCDYWVVFNELQHEKETTCCNPGNVIFLGAESHSLHTYISTFLNQFAHVITCQREIRHKSVSYKHQGNPWFVNKSYDELMENNCVKKTKQISIITSNKQFTPGHRKRYEFTMALKNYFGEAIDLFGRGIKDFDDKWDVLAPYKYSIPIENDVCDDWITEKLYDCYLAHTFPFYYGSPNLDFYYPKKSFLRIDINNLDNSKRIIENILNDPLHYERHLDFLIQAKKKYLNHYNIFPLIIGFIEEKKLNPNLPKETIILRQHLWDPYSITLRTINKIQRTFHRRINNFLAK